jgi:hypothetical protein
MTDTATVSRQEKLAVACSVVGTVVVLGTYWHMLNNGFGLLSQPDLPLYESWLPAGVGGVLLLYGSAKIRGKRPEGKHE